MKGKEILVSQAFKNKNMSKNKNQNDEYDIDNDNIEEDDRQDYNNAVPSWMAGSSDDSDEDEDYGGDKDNYDEEGAGHESLIDDQDINIEEYEEEDKNPLSNKDDDGSEDDTWDEEEEKEPEGAGDDSSDSVNIAKSKIVLIKKLLSNIKDNSDKLNRLLGVLVTSEDEARINISEASEGIINTAGDDASKIVEGVFDGENMIGPDGKQYSVPSNYASKSKLVEGDILKLTITQKGTFVYKQIKPIERDRVIGTLEKTLDGSYIVSSGSKKWKILTASVTYFKGDLGDEAVILVPRASDSKWAAVENIIKNK